MMGCINLDGCKDGFIVNVEKESIEYRVVHHEYYVFDYFGSVRSHDLALIILPKSGGTEIPFSSDAHRAIGPVCLPNINEDYYEGTGNPVSATGFGRESESGAIVQILRKVDDLEIVDTLQGFDMTHPTMPEQEKQNASRFTNCRVGRLTCPFSSDIGNNCNICGSLYAAGKYESEIREGNLAKIREMKGICAGDSGGPLTAVQFNGARVLLGVVSSSPPQCGGYDVYTRVRMYLPWIVEWIEKANTI